MPCSLMRRMMAKFSFTNSGDRPSDGSSISSSFGSPIRPRPIDTIACSPPDSVPASWARRSCRRGNRSNTSSRRSRMTRRVVHQIGAERADSPRRVSLANMRRPSGMQAMPAAITRCVAQAGDLLAGEADRAGRAAASGPEWRASACVLPAPLAPRRQVMLPGVDRQRHAVQHVGLVVAGGDAVDGEERAHSTPR